MVRDLLQLSVHLRMRNLAANLRTLSTSLVGGGGAARFSIIITIILHLLILFAAAKSEEAKRMMMMMKTRTKVSSSLLPYLPVGKQL